MMRMSLIGSLAFFLAATGCARRDRAQAPWMAPAISDSALTLVWCGQGEAWRHGSGGWARDSAYDYSFTVTQRRDGARWRSAKSLRRHHPAYDGKAGSRDQVMHFALDFRSAGEGLASKVASSLGDGEGRCDRQFREQWMELEAAGAGAFAPYSHFRITQSYRYERGRLEETVELFRRDRGRHLPFMKIEERAHIFTRDSLPGAPTRFGRGDY